ncbi:MAG TPA: GNAT family N-acetyltransferase [Polyangia bacterium]|jgi:predicted acetyltransferase|nr:GNAT family N-acetyltransferase [Polyangia bacterium]
MNVQVTPATNDDRARFTALLELYVYDFSELVGLDVGDDGRFALPNYDKYWTEPRCHAFLVRVDDKLAGFALVQRRSYLSGDETVTDMAEFFVLRRYRRHGVGERAASALFDRFAGWWEVRQRLQNSAATAFWRRIIDRYTGGKFADSVRDDTRWRGPVQRFDSRVAVARRG